MMTKDQYIDSLRGLHLNLYSFGKKVENVVDNPIVRPSLNSFAATYELADAASARSEDRSVLPALCRHGRSKCGLFDYVRDR